MMLFKNISTILILLLSVLLISCDEEEDDSTQVGGIEPITTSWDADTAAQKIVSAIDQGIKLGNGSYANETVSGTSGGSALVTGTVSYQGGISCGSSCVSSQNNTYLTIEFSNFSVPTSSNGSTQITGTVQFSNTEWNRQSGLSYSSGGSVSISGSNINYRWSYVTSAGITHGNGDTILSVNSSGSWQNQSGTLTTTRGDSFSF